MLDASGNLRSLEGVVPDIGGHTLTSDGMQSLRSVDPESLPLVEGNTPDWRGPTPWSAPSV